MTFTLKNLTSLIQVALTHNASDVHLRTDETPSLRIKGELVPVQTKNFSAEDIYEIISILLHGKNIDHELAKNLEIDGAFQLEQICRLRFNIFRYFHQYGIVLRIIQSNIPTLQSLNMPPILAKISQQRKGLILITGPTGSGKSTTMSAMLEHINTESASHIITIEDPIEYLHPQKKSRISQREVGKDTLSFADGLRAALRQDPDVISIGELRDAETVQIALKAAETGHLVISTMHTSNTITTINRIISFFPTVEQIEVRNRLAESLYAVVGQMMLKGKNGSMLVAQEIMLTNPGIKDCILGKDDINRIHQIINQGLGKSINGCQTFDHHVMQLFNKGLISKEVAQSAVSSERDFLQKLIIE